jgi:hypothetical protein
MNRAARGMRSMSASGTRRTGADQRAPETSCVATKNIPETASDRR